MTRTVRCERRNDIPFGPPLGLLFGNRYRAGGYFFASLVFPCVHLEERLARPKRRPFQILCGVGTEEAWALFSTNYRQTSTFGIERRIARTGQNVRTAVDPE